MKGLEILIRGLWRKLITKPKKMFTVTGGTTSSKGVCDQVITPIGPYTGGFTARISKISPNGTRTTVVDGLPSDQTSASQGSLVSGVADVAFLNGKLYAILAGARCSDGLAGTDNGVIRVDSDGNWVIGL